MLKEGSYPYPLKERILGKEGHLSNYDASLLLLEHAGPRLKTVFLSHLSKVNNTPDLALATFQTIIAERKDLELEVCLSLQDEASQLIRI
jgi:phosphoribosyl 1,2-cyclic phosphodiesterase